MNIKQITKISTICEIFNSCVVDKEMFKEYHKLTKLYLTIPVTIATAERIFNRLTCKCGHLIRIHQRHPNSPKKPLPSFASPPWGQFLYEEFIAPIIQDWIWSYRTNKSKKVI
ncbi:unnamed protein product [Rotaria magnacalcarata]